MPYIGRSSDFGIRNVFHFLASNGDTSVSGADADGKNLSFVDGLYIDVYLNGVRLKSGEDYNTATANTVAGMSALNANDEVNVVVYDTFAVADTVQASTGGTFSGAVTFASTATFSGTVVGISSAADDITAGDAAVNITTTTGNITIDAQGNDTDIILKGTDGTVDTTFLTIDGSAAGAASFNNNITYSGDLISSTSGTSNFVAGVNAGNSIASGGNYNVTVGDEAGTALTTGDNNVAIGFEALTTEDADGSNTAVGYRALKTLNAGAEGLNTAVGKDAGTAVTTGRYNTFVGAITADSVTEGGRNTALGYGALQTDTLGSRSVALGFNALGTQNFTTANDNYNIGVGYDAGGAITTGYANVIMGGLAGDALTTGFNNVVIGKGALGTEDTGRKNVAIGFSALATQNSDVDNLNVAIGFEAATALTTGVQSVFVGYEAGAALTIGTNNVLIGGEAGKTMVGDNNNVAVGWGALKLQTTASSTARNNTAVGYGSGGAITTGEHNSFFGLGAGDTGTTANRCTVVGYQCDVSATGAFDQTVLGNNVVGANSAFVFGTGSSDSSVGNGGTSISAPSDQRYKESIETSTAGLGFINDLRPVTYKWKMEKDIPTDHRAYVKDSTTRVMNAKDELYHGFIAQEVKAVVDNHSEIKNYDELWSENDDGRQRLAPGFLIPMLTKAIQELSAKNDALEVRIKTLEDA